MSSLDVLAARIAEAEKETALAEKRAATANKTSKKYMRDLETELRAVEADQKVDFLLKKLTTVNQAKCLSELTQTEYKAQMEQLLVNKDGELQRVTKLKNALEQLCRELQTSNQDLLGKLEAIRTNEVKKREELEETYKTLVSTMQSQLTSEQDARLQMETTQNKRQAVAEALVAEYETLNKACTEALSSKDAEIKKLRDLLDRNMSLLTSMEAETVELRAICDLYKRKDAQHKAEFEAYTSDISKKVAETSIAVGRYKAELDRLGKDLKRSESDRVALSGENKRLSGSVIVAMEKQQQTEKQLTSANAKVAALEKLCRALQQQQQQQQTPTTAPDQPAAPAKDETVNTETH